MANSVTLIPSEMQGPCASNISPEFMVEGGVYRFVDEAKVKNTAPEFIGACDVSSSEGRGRHCTVTNNT
ncbi:hypothetical protein BV25DRAFT_1825925 [Artomyces pyxidatus]|uniref:Uncharacterized protein n=1 Tax=Artomyces pyxidatus TaxID=48021 RepID=A0ACB8T0T5_9AGAM|nr:hypothetical protein BV25DRAFT_1825925 [Artomyces pyxidatus]